MDHVRTFKDLIKCLLITNYFKFKLDILPKRRYSKSSDKFIMAVFNTWIFECDGELNINYKQMLKFAIS